MPEAASADSTGEFLDFAREFFVEVVKGAIEAQERLDRRPAEGPSPRFHIPRLGVDVEFEFERATGSEFLIFFGKREERRHRHRLRFTLLASPQAPAPVEAGGSPRIQIGEPSFLTPTSGGTAPNDLDEEYLTDRIIELLQECRSGSSGAPVAFDIGGRRDKDEWREKLDQEIQQLIENPEDVVSFRIDWDGQTRYLVVRMAKKAKKDSLFVYSRGGPSELTVYSFHGDGVRRVSYEPLHRMGLGIRDWIQSRESRRRTLGGEIEDGYGIGNLKSFVKFLERSIAEALGHLLENSLDSGVGGRTYYELGAVTADLSYSVQKKPGGLASLSFEDRLPFGDREAAAPGEDEHTFIESKVRIEASRSAGRLEFGVELLSPEFVLVDHKLAAFIAAARRSEADIAARCAGHDAVYGEDEYRNAIRDEQAAEGVVALLSFKGETPTNWFLVTWPGSGRTEGLDFVFSGKLRYRGQEREAVLTDIKPLLSLGERIGAATGIDAEEAEAEEESEELSGKEYRAYHNFFHAVQMWRSRTMRA